IILGCPWLRRHCPELRWDPCDVTRWSKQCHTQCLSNLPLRRPVPIQVASTHVESPEPAFTPAIPAEYAAFQDVFSKQAATQLPPHRPWDCAIELLPGAQLPKGHVYPLSNPEHQTMKEYIAEALSQEFIQPSTSPAASNYRQLNSQILQQPYPLPLVPATLEELCGARVFTKLDLWSAYNLVRIRAGDEWKTAFVTPTGHYEYWVMPYGLSISPSVFQTLMNEVFREFLHRFVGVYIDDILIYSWNLAGHRQHVQQVLHKLCEHSLYLKLEKCEFHQPLVQFLGMSSVSRVCKWIRGKSTPFKNGLNPAVFFQFLPSLHQKLQLHYDSVMLPTKLSNDSRTSSAPHPYYITQIENSRLRSRSMLPPLEWVRCSLKWS
ncbi:hypothetical protein M9458_007445, partial [Cirrhinus mrigala]